VPKYRVGEAGGVTYYRPSIPEVVKERWGRKKERGKKTEEREEERGK
jgi:hypothetical protein